MPTVMYAAITDPYCYSGTTVLKNRLGLRKQAKLAAFENQARCLRERSHQRACRPGCPSGPPELQALSGHSPASVPGRVFMGREGEDRSHIQRRQPVCYPEHIDREMKRLFADLRRRKFLRDVNVAEFAAGAAHFLAEVNAIHPFREGNGRTQLSFLKVMAERAGYPMAWSVAAHAAILRATVRSFGGDEQPLAKIILQSVRHRRR
jgi:cell filamentation protein